MKLEPDCIDKSYMAGFFDGEGCITFQQTSRNKNGTIGYSPLVSVVNTSFELLSVLQSKFGGKLYKRTTKNINHNTTWALTFVDRDSKKIFLEYIVDYLFLKKPQAQLVLDYIKRRERKVFKRGQHVSISNDEISIVRSVREINSKNSNKSSDFLSRFPVESRGTL